MRNKVSRFHLLIVLGVISCASHEAPLLILPEIPPNPAATETLPVANRADVQQEIVRAYPLSLLAQGAAGRVEVWIAIDSTGQAKSGAIKTTSGNAALDCAAM